MEARELKTHVLPTPSGQGRGKRRRPEESEKPRKSARIAQIQQGQRSSIRGSGDRGTQLFCDCVREQKTTQLDTHSSHRKRPPLQGDKAGQSRKRQRVTSKEDRPVPDAGGIDEDEPPIAYWSRHHRWPPHFPQDRDEMENMLARKRSVSSRSRKNSDVSTTPSANTQTEQKSREQKSAEYRAPQYETVLATKGVLMKPSPQGVTTASKDWCKELLDQEQTYPPNTLFEDDLFDSTCELVRNRNETRVIRDIALLIVPSAEVFAIRGAVGLQKLIESVNEGWNNAFPITKTRPQPDFAVGFSRDAFTQDQLDRMQPVVGDFNDQSFFMATWYMYFPFLTCEVKCGAAALDIADRQNAHSAALAVRAVVELFRAVKREKELHREILAFSISHDDRTVRIYGYYAELEESTTTMTTKYYRCPIHEFSFAALNGKEKWTAYKFTKNVYDNWMPMHFKRICSAIDQIPANISFSVSHSEMSFSGPSGLSQEFGAHQIAASSVGSESVQAHDQTGSSIGQDNATTPSTSVADGVSFKRPRTEQPRR